MPLFCSRDSIDTEDLKTHVPVAPFLSHNSEHPLFTREEPDDGCSLINALLLVGTGTKIGPGLFQQVWAYVGALVSLITRKIESTNNRGLTNPPTRINRASWFNRHNCKHKNTRALNCTSHLRPTCVISEFQACNSCSLEVLQLSNKRAGCSASSSSLSLPLTQPQITYKHTHKDSHTLLQAVLFPVIRQHKHVWGKTGRLYELMIKLMPKENS